MSDYTLSKDKNYLVNGKREVRDKNGKLIRYANDIQDARRQMKEKDGGTVEEEK